MKTIEDILKEECFLNLEKALETNGDFSTKIIPLICFYLGKIWEKNPNDALAIFNLVSHIIIRKEIPIPSSTDKVYELLKQKFLTEASDN